MAKKDKTSKKSQAQRDDTLFEALGLKKKRRKRKIIITTLSIVLVLAIVAVVGVIFLKKKVREEFATTTGEVLSYDVTTGTISTVVSGSGSLTDMDLTTVSVPEGVEVTEILVEANQAIAQGDVLATVDMTSVINTMAELQTEIEDLDDQISNAEGDEADDTVYAGVSGRIKAIYATADAEVAEVMNTSGSLALLSLDGYMAFDVETTAFAEGSAVQVKRADGSVVNGTVETVNGGKATVLVSDNGPLMNEAVTLLNSDGTDLCAGTLYVHSPLRVTGYAGIVSKIHVSENAKVSATTKLFTLDDTAYSANYKTLLRDRTEKEELLLFLLGVKRDGAVLAESAGSVYSVGSEEDEHIIATLSNDKKMSVTIDVDEADILSLEVGQTVSVTVKSVSESAFSGTLTEINRTSSSSGTYSAVVELDKQEGMLSGMTASVSVQIEGVENAILIPLEALHKTSDGAYVYTSYNEELQEYGGKVDVVTGIENSTYVEIKSGLKVGDKVYYTEEQSSFGGMNGMPNFGGSGSGMPSFDGGNMPSFGGSGGGMPSFEGGSRPDFGGSGNRPSRS